MNEKSSLFLVSSMWFMCVYIADIFTDDKIVFGLGLFLGMFFGILWIFAEDKE